MAAFYIANDVALEIAEILRAAGHTAVTARDLRREASTDDGQLLVASYVHDQAAGCAIKQGRAAAAAGRHAGTAPTNAHHPL